VVEAGGSIKKAECEELAISTFLLLLHKRIVVAHCQSAMKRSLDANAWIDKLPPEKFPSAIREVFDFLCRDYGFRDPVTEKTSLTLRLSYRAHRVAIEISVDFRDRAVEVALVRLADGQRPDGWAIDSQGRQFMVRISEAARFRKIPNPHMTISADASPQSILRFWLEAWAEQLRTHFADILADSDTLF